MAYNKRELENKAIIAILENNLMFQDEIPPYMGISERTFYYHKMQELQSIKKALNENRIKAKHEIREKWYKSENPVVQIAFMKLVGDDNEYHRLSGTRHEQKHSGEITIKTHEGDSEL